jgi:hypothetical protein
MAQFMYLFRGYLCYNMQMNQHGERRGSFDFSALRKRIGNLLVRLMTGETPERLQWIERRNRTVGLLHDPLYQHLHVLRAESIVDALVAGGAPQNTALQIARQRMELVYMCTVGSLPRGGLNDSELRTMGIDVEPADLQNGSFRLVTLPEGWALSPLGSDVDGPAHLAQVTDEQHTVRLDVALLMGGPDGTYGDVSLHAPEPQTE